MGRLAKLQSLLPVWARIVRYANADFEEVRPKELVENLEELVALCTLWVTKLDPTEFNVEFKASGAQSVQETLLRFALQDQPNIRKVLRWLCTPNEDLRLANGALTFLWDQVEGIKRAVTLNETFDPTGKQGIPVLYWKRFKWKGSLGAVYEFIWNGLERYNDGDNEFREIIPLGICERPACNKFMVLERKGRKRFCSDNCRVQANQRSSQDWAAYMRDYRKRYDKTKKEMLSKPIRIFKKKRSQR